MMDTETRGPMSPTRLPRMILEDRYSGLLEVVVKSGRRAAHGAVRPPKLKRDLDRVLQGPLEGLVRHELSDEQGAFIEDSRRSSIRCRARCQPHDERRADRQGPGGEDIRLVCDT